MRNKKNLLQLCVLMLLCPFFLFNCAELYFASLDCLDEDGESSGFCRQMGDTDLLVRQPADILFVLNHSEEMRELNDTVSDNLKRFLKCMKPTDWQVGFISTVNNDAAYVGELMPLELNGQLSTKRFIRSDMENYETLFDQSVSLHSGCHLPPYCKGESVTSMNAIKAFMDNPNNQDMFFRKETPLTMIVISSFDDSDASSAESALSAVHRGYSGYADHFMSLTVTAPGTEDDCIKTVKDNLTGGLQTVSRIATGIGFMSYNPLVIMGATLFGVLTSMGFNSDPEEIKKDIRNMEIVRFTTMTGGRVLNICHPKLGEAIAFSILERIGMEDRVSDDCKDFEPTGKKRKTLDPSIEI